jgi:glutamate synthase domain-containing protein 2
VHKGYLETGAAIEIKIGQGAKPGIGGHLPGAKIVGDVSRTRMIPEGSDAISPTRTTIFIRLKTCGSSCSP